MINFVDLYNTSIIINLNNYNMNKILRYSLLALLSVVFNYANATDVTFDFSTEAGITAMGLVAPAVSAGTDLSTFTYQSLTFTPTNGSTNTRIWNSQGTYSLRVYNGGGAFNIAAPNGGTITKIVITASSATNFNFTADAGEYSVSDLVGTWTGSQNAVTFTYANAKKNAQISTIAVTYEAGAPETGFRISGTTPFSESTVVTIYPSNPDNEIYYTTDGTDPRTSDTYIHYHDPFTLTATTTVKAAEEDATGKLSDVIEKTFVYNGAAKVDNIAAFKALANNTEAILTLKDAQVLYAGSKDIFVKDATGAVDFYSTGLTLKDGQLLNGTITGKSTNYNKLPELAKTSATNADGYKTTDGKVTPTVVTIPAAKADIYVCDLVKINNVKLDSLVSGKYTNLYASIAKDTIQVYDKFKIGITGIDMTKTYSIVGIIVPFGSGYELCPINNFTGATANIDEVNSIKEFKALASGAKANLNLTNAQVLYTWTSTSGNTVTFVRDNTGAVEFFNTGLTLANNQMLNGSVVLQYSLYNNMPEALKTEGTNADKLTITEGSEAEPKVVTIKEGKDNLCDLIMLKSVYVKVGTDTKYYAINADNDSVQLYNGFHLEGMDFSAYDVTKLYDVKGIMEIFKTTGEVYPIEITEASTGINNLMTTVEDKNAPIYNAAGQRVNESYKGLVIKNGKKYIAK
jgi:hypothetical protein